ncbi:hypothetical protein E1B28_013888 [Marasmius oreades]|uniref:Cyclohexanone monooxygenase n=1 Tax=Marasmius oreades TaxID=181124 RepID=A0A9P7RK11_9AGAR|nr:uncharacterized protein E1B28_013888 [Marasmius oreades]KAG7085275.1 hypothetical protein E1B28_013888 [Marasmius oreades]
MVFMRSGGQRFAQGYVTRRCRKSTHGLPSSNWRRRLSLEQTYYEVFNQDNVDLIDLNENPIAEFTSKGIVTGDGKEHEFDVIVLATGWDGVTGAMTKIDIRGIGGQTVAEKWKDGVYTNLGMTVSGFPNMFFMSGPQAPTAFSVGPSCIEPQGDWIANVIKHMKKNHLTKIEATPEAEQIWRGMVMSIHDKLLVRNARVGGTELTFPENQRKY